MSDKMKWTVNTKHRKVISFDEEKEREWSKPFFFIQGADSQYGLISRYIEKNDVVTWEKEVALTEAIIERVNKMEPPPRFFIVCGDLIDALQDAPERESQEKTFKEIFGRVRSDVPLLCVCGNHDVGDHPTPASIQRYKDSFGDDYYSFLCGGILFIVINSQYLFDSTQAPLQSEEHSKWLDGTLQKAQKNGIKRIIVFQHIPWFLKEIQEEDHAYFSLKRTVREEWLPKLKAAGLEAAFCGHYHRNAGGEYEGIPVVVTSAIGGQLGQDRSGARVVSVYKDSIQHKYYAIEDLPLNNS